MGLRKPMGCRHLLATLCQSCVLFEIALAVFHAVLQHNVTSCTRRCCLVGVRRHYGFVMIESSSAPIPVAGDRLLDLPGADPLALRRDDLAAVVAGYRRESRSPRMWAGLVTGIGGLLGAALLITLGGRLGWPEVLGPVFFFGGWAVLLASFGVVWHRERQLRARYQIQCPACGKPLLDGTLGRPGVPRAELAIATGNCPHCGTRILAP